MDEQPKARVLRPEKAWRLRIRFDVSSLNPPAVQYGLFSEDPIVQFAARLNQVENVYRAQLNEIEDPEKQKIVRGMQLAAVWRLLFRAIRGDEVYLLIPGQSGIGLMSNAADGKKWLVTEAVEISSRKVCWSMPFEVVAGQETEVSLTEGNALDLATLDKDG